MFVGHRTKSGEFLHISFCHHSSEFQSLQFTKYIQSILKNDSCIFIYLIITLSSALSSVQNNITSPCFQHTMLKTFQSFYGLFFFLFNLPWEQHFSTLTHGQSGGDNFLLWIVLIILGRLATPVLDTNNTPPPLSCDNQKCLQIWLNFPGNKNCSWFRTIILELTSSHCACSVFCSISSGLIWFICLDCGLMLFFHRYLLPHYSGQWLPSCLTMTENQWN